MNNQRIYFQSYKHLNEYIQSVRYDYRKTIGTYSEITEDEHEYFLCVLPPLRLRGDDFFLSEMLTQNLAYHFYSKTNDGVKRYYVGVRPLNPLTDYDIVGILKPFGLDESTIGSILSTLATHLTGEAVYNALKSYKWLKLTEDQIRFIARISNYFGI